MQQHFCQPRALLPCSRGPYPLCRCAVCAPLHEDDMAALHSPLEVPSVHLSATCLAHFQTHVHLQPTPSLTSFALMVMLAVEAVPRAALTGLDSTTWNVSAPSVSLSSTMVTRMSCGVAAEALQTPHQIPDTR